MSTIAVNSITDANGGNTAQINGATPTSYNTMGKNRIINGDMRIAQRGTSGTPTSGGAYVSVDRWNARAATSTGHTAAQSTTSAVGFTNSLLFTTGTGASPAAGDRNWLRQSVEGFNIADLAWGTANAKTITVSFQVRSSLTGTFAAAVVNDAGDRAWPFTFTISAANTFETKSATITGPTDGTWGSSNDVGLALSFDMGCGSNYEGTAGQWNTSNKLTVSGATKVIATSGATFYITGVQLEVGSVATEFERRPYGTELQLCQRYYQYDGSTTPFVGNTTSGSTYGGNVFFRTSMRAAPTVTQTHVTSSGFPGTTPTSSEITTEKFWSTKASDGTGNGNFYKMTWVATAEL